MPEYHLQHSTIKVYKERSDHGKIIITGKETYENILRETIIQFLKFGLQLLALLENNS